MLQVWKIHEWSPHDTQKSENSVFSEAKYHIILFG